ncbi:hypothetical protein V7183_24515 [Bacillus sp. JJ1127]|uniref:hypothetical protein n=1 Tax=Bacillus sp. JJ1127 TaxID=3122952 RepID=UPI002FFF2A64
MYKKLLSFVMFGSIIALTACGTTEKTESKPKEETKQTQNNKDLTSQDELNKKIKLEAEEINFVKANGEEYEKGKRLKATGTVDLLLKSSAFPSFVLTTDENNGKGMYSIQIAQSGVQSNENEIVLKNGLKITKGTAVTIYGAYDGKDKTGMPKISAPLIEGK